ncbi:MAG: UDP-N-acetylmuramate--L-alanine ligase [Clostridia bacterium]|nr:UDP-N-acetylmuramate--L-alanine ligase [Clostridia bacterium]
MKIEELDKIFEKAKILRFIGIGGISMSSLAMIALDRGFEVTGYDKSRSSLTEKLENAGIAIDYEPSTGAVDLADAVIYTAAMKPDHPEMAHAAATGKPLIKRAEFLGYIMQRYVNRIGVAGMHGKSTTTSMLSQIFMESAVDPTIVNGAELKVLEGGAYRVGGSRHFIFEACEYTDSFLSFLPTVAVVLNIDRDHVDYFLSMEQTIDSFKRYISLAPCALVNWDDARVRVACEGYGGKLVKAGIESDDVDYRAVNISYERGFGEFDIEKRGGLLGHIKLGVPGSHNVLDALIAAAASDLSGIDFESISRGLAEFKGAHRRMERVGSYNGIEIYDDYAHHPKEIKTTLEGASRQGYERVWCIFQPHTYSRTAGLFDEFSRAFGDADRLILADIYSARETNTFGISSEDLAKAAGNGAIYLPSFEEIENYIRENARPGDLILTMGAGDVYKIGQALNNEENVEDQ